MEKMEQIFPAGTDPANFERVSPGHWQDPVTGIVFYTGTEWTPPAPVASEASTETPEPTETPTEEHPND